MGILRRLGMATVVATVLVAPVAGFAGAATAAADFSTGPTLEPIPDQTVNELSQLSVTAHADDPDLPNDVLRFSLAGGPVNASITPAGRITWTPTEADGPGTFTIRVRVEDASGEEDIQSFRVTVNEINSAPEIGFIPDQALGSGDQIDIDVTVSDRDKPANTFTFTAAGLPPGATIDRATGRITGTVTATEAGASGVATITATDNGSPPLDTVRSFSWLITSGNRAPVMEPLEPQMVDGDGMVRFTVTATDADPGDTLSYWLTEGIDPVPAGASIDEDTGVFTWQPVESQYDAVYQINVGVSDSGSPRLSATQLVTIVLPEYNVPPDIEPVPDQTSAEGDLVSLQVLASDSNVVDRLEYFAADLPPGLQLDAITGVISGEISYEAAGDSPYEVTITVTDSGTPKASSEVSFIWHVDNTNRPPVVSPMSIVALSGQDTPIELDASDPDGDPLIYTLVEAPNNGRLEGDPPALIYVNVKGSSDKFTFSVSDGEFDVALLVSIELRTSNEPPQAGVDEYDLTVGDRLEVAAPGVLGNDTDPDNESLAAVLVAAPDHGDLILEADGSFSYTPDPGYVGADKFTYAAVDAFGERASATVVLNVQPVATEPEPGTTSQSTGIASSIVTATAAAWQQPEVDGGGVLPRIGRAVAGVIHGGISSLSDIGYPLLLLAAALLLALTVGKVSLVPAGAGRSQSEGVIEWYDARRGFGVLVPSDGGDEVYLHAGAIEEGFSPSHGRHVEFIAADIKGRRVALKVWAT